MHFYFTKNYLDNIEQEKRLLTLTAWYCISKNDLFLEYEYLCLLEYDVILEDGFFDNLTEVCSSNQYDVISFLYSSICLEWETRKKVLNLFMNKKSMTLPADRNYSWMPTTNQCLRRYIVGEFVDWYYPDCKILQERDPRFFSHYHERLFSYYVKEANKSIGVISGLQHLFLGSHEHFTGGT